jgi:hypothetical protein
MKILNYFSKSHNPMNTMYTKCFSNTFTTSKKFVNNVIIIVVVVVVAVVVDVRILNCEKDETFLLKRKVQFIFGWHPVYQSITLTK